MSTMRTCGGCLWWIPIDHDYGHCQLALDAGQDALRGAGKRCASWRDVESEA